MKAPQEEVEYPQKKFDVEVSYLLRKRTCVKTDNYELEHDDFERQAFINTELTDWESAYKETHFTMEEMLDQLRRYVEFEMITVEPNSRRGQYLERLYNDLQDWEVVESEFVEL